MTQSVSDDVLGKFARKQTDWFTRVMAGSLDPEEVGVAIQAIIDRKTVYLTPLFADETIMLPATKGAVTLADSAAIFEGFLDADLKNWQTDKRGKNTKLQAMSVLEQSKDGNLRQIFESFGSLDRSVMSQEQIAQFCVTHRDKLRQEGWGTFFLFKVGAEYFVASVRVVVDGRLGLDVSRLDYPGVWGAQRRGRVVVPQLDA